MFVLAIAAVFGGTTYAAARVMDTGPTIAELRAKRAKHEAAQARRERKSRKRAKHEASQTRRERKSRKRAAQNRKGPHAAAPTHAAAASRSRRPWADRADSLCNDMFDDMLAHAVATSAAPTPQDALRLFDASLRMNGRFIVRLERLGPAPKRRVHTRLMRELYAGQVTDARYVQSLRARWSTRLVERMRRESRGRSVRLRRLAERLSAAESLCGLGHDRRERR